ncbi:unnamed protein product [Symbiodinium sp. KB8]|nr:unnamed protein product [Symbiodinium sp. KB8]
MSLESISITELLIMLMTTERKATTFPQLDWRSKLCYAVRRPEPDSRGYCIIHPSSSLNDPKFQYDSKWVKIEAGAFMQALGCPSAAEEDVIYFDNVMELPLLSFLTVQTAVQQKLGRARVLRRIALTFAVTDSFIFLRTGSCESSDAMFIASGATGSDGEYVEVQLWDGRQRQDLCNHRRGPVLGGFAAMVASGARTFAPKASRFGGTLGCPEPRHQRGHSEILCASGARLAELGEAKWLVQCACRQQSAMCVEPTPSELRQWWEGVRKFQPSSVTQALEHQVQAGWDGGAPDWRPQFRGLHFLHFMRQQGGEPGAAAHAVVCKLHPLLHFLLAEVPQFATIATRLLFFEPTSTSLEDEEIHCLPAIGPRFREAKAIRLAVDEPIASERGLEGLVAEKNETHSQTSTDTAGEFERILADLESDSQPEVEMPLPYIPRSPAPFRSGQFWGHSVPRPPPL